MAPGCFLNCPPTDEGGADPTEGFEMTQIAVVTILTQVVEHLTMEVGRVWHDIQAGRVVTKPLGTLPFSQCLLLLAFDYFCQAVSYRTKDVYGITRELPLNYVERGDVDQKADNLIRDKHIVIYGSSKQGKPLFENIAFILKIIL